MNDCCAPHRTSSRSAWRAAFVATASVTAAITLRPLPAMADNPVDMVAVRPGRIVAVIGSDLVVLNASAPDHLRLVGRLEIDHGFRLWPGAGIVAPDGRTAAIQNGKVTQLFALPTDGPPRRAGRIEPVAMGSAPSIAFVGARLARFEANNLLVPDASTVPVTLRWFDISDATAPKVDGAAFWSGAYGVEYRFGLQLVSSPDLAFLLRIMNTFGADRIDQVEVLDLANADMAKRSPAIKPHGFIVAGDADGPRVWLSIQTASADGEKMGQPGWQAIEGTDPMSPTIRAFWPQPTLPALWTIDDGIMWSVTPTDDQLDGVLSSFDAHDADHPLPLAAMSVIGQATSIDAMNGWVAVGSASGEIGLVEANTGIPTPRGWWPSDEPNRLPPLATATLSPSEATASPTPVIDRASLTVRICMPVVLRRHFVPGRIRR